jgi:hypothetical protein
MAFARTLQELRGGRDASCAHAGTAQRGYLALVSTSSSQDEWHKALC